MKTMDEMIRVDSQAICDNIDDLAFKSRDKVAQNMLSYFRNLIEHIAIKIYLDTYPNTEVDRDTTGKAIEHLKTDYQYYFLRQFHNFLQMSRSHYTPDNDGAERLVLKYYEYLLQTKNLMKKKYNMDILQNLEDFPLDLDETLQEYYEKIVEKLEKPRYLKEYDIIVGDKFYVQKTKAFFVNKQVYYEITLIPANDDSSKFNRFVVFSKNKITTNYAIRINAEDDIIEIEGQFMPVKILLAWNCSIRPCELVNFAKLFNIKVEVRADHAEYKALMNYLTRTGLNLVEILESSDTFYEGFKSYITSSARAKVLSTVFDEARHWVKNKKRGSNTVRYLLFCLNNKIIKLQLSKEENYKISGLYIKTGTLTFEDNPFNSGLLKHNPSIYDLISCIGIEGHEDELLARKITVNADSYGKLYTNIDELEEFENIEQLISKYNKKLYSTHQHRRLEMFGENIFIKGYEDNTLSIIQKIIELTRGGIDNYRASVEAWLLNNPNEIDCDEKEAIIKTMFEDSKIAMIYGAAGTGKSTLINHVSRFWNDSKKLYIANTHPAVENLKRKVKAANTEFLTIKKYLNRYPKTDILFIDECSMVNNRDMVEILRNGKFELLVLVGDVYQIESIQFGNWFNLARSFVPLKVQYELVKPYRTNDKNLLELWGKVRNYEDDITECLNANGYISNLNKTIFDREEDNDEIVLCLNYAGLYGINNINRFLQSANNNKAVALGVWIYKVRDPILFNESSIYEGVLYNNLKGRIVNIEETTNEVYFSIEIDKVLNGMNVAGTRIELLPQRIPEKSIVRFPVKKRQEGDDDGDEMDMETNVPFQIAYAVSIHKAQGLEYKSVKIIITKEIDELISHNIFYTAITRTKEKLKIYWTAESQQKILSSFKDDMSLNDAKIFSVRTGMKKNKRRF